MPYSDKILEIDDLRAAIQSRSPLPPDVLKKVNYKFRLEWNYTSNSMEGNSLTRSETRSVMIGNITVHGKPIKDVLEMKGHDEIITGILKMGAGEVQLSETRIRDIHMGIMHEDDPEKASLIGKWKTQDNYLFNYKNERIDFTPHAEVQDAIHQLLNWLSAEREKIARGTKDALHPALLAFRFHLEYVSIHPFYDGNGRTARILTNLILIAYGYPPVWVREDERNAYYQYLADIQGYGGSSDIFYEFMAGLLLRSQQLVMDAVEGKEIEAPDDVDKEIALFKKSLSDEPDALPKNNKDIFARYEDSIKPLFELFVKKHMQFEELFYESWVESYPDDRNGGQGLEHLDKSMEEMKKQLGLWENEDQEGRYEAPPVEVCSIHYHFSSFRKTGTNTFDIHVTILCGFLAYEWQLFNGENVLSKFYSQPLSQDEIETFVRETVRNTFQEIKEKVGTT